jgi:hypothetical protein
MTTPANFLSAIHSSTPATACTATGSTASKGGSSFAAEITSLISKALGAGAALATGIALPGVAGLGLSQASDKAVQSLFQNLISSSESGLSKSSEAQTSSQATDLNANQNALMQTFPQGIIPLQSAGKMYQVQGLSKAGSSPTLSFLA